jgi:hypothetical protein
VKTHKTEGILEIDVDNGSLKLGKHDSPSLDGKVKISYKEIWKFSCDTLPEK